MCIDLEKGMLPEDVVNTSQVGLGYNYYNINTTFYLLKSIRSKSNIGLLSKC